MFEKKVKFVASTLTGMGIFSYLAAVSLFFVHGATTETADLMFLSSQPSVSLIQTIQQRGYVKCAVAENRPGYSAMLTIDPTPNDQLSPKDHNQEFYINAKGIEADMCRAAAIGLFGELENRVYFKNYDGNWVSRMDAVQSGDVDILFRGTAMTQELGLTHDVMVLPVIYLEPIFVIAPKNIAGGPDEIPIDASVCVVDRGILHFASMQYVRSLDKDWVLPEAMSPPKKYNGYKMMLEDYKAGECQILIGRYSSVRAAFANHKLAQEHNRFSLGDAYYVPIAGTVKGGERDWYNLVTQSIWTTMKAQAHGFTSKAVPEGFNSKAWKLMGLNLSNPSEIIKYIGNYTEIHQRSLGHDLPELGPNRHFLENSGGRLLLPF